MVLFLEPNNVRRSLIFKYPPAEEGRIPDDETNIALSFPLMHPLRLHSSLTSCEYSTWSYHLISCCCYSIPLSWRTHALRYSLHCHAWTSSMCRCNAFPAVGITGHEFDDVLGSCHPALRYVSVFHSSIFAFFPVVVVVVISMLVYCHFESRRIIVVFEIPCVRFFRNPVWAALSCPWCPMFHIW